MTIAAWETVAGLVLEDGSRWGDRASPLQRNDARAILDRAEPSRHWLGRTRGFSKTTDVAAMSTAVMLTQAPPGARLYAAASDRDQARLLLDSLGGFVTRTPEIAGAISLEAWKAHAASGVVLEVLAADAASAYGLRPWWLVIDELCQWPDTLGARRFYEALTSALPKIHDARLVVITTAGDPGHFSRRVYDNALVEPNMWRVSDSHDTAPWINPDLIAAEQRRLPESSFSRLWRNEWAQTEDAAFLAADVTACVADRASLDPQPTKRYVLTVDLGWRHDPTSLCVAHRELRDKAWRVVIDRVETISPRADQEVNLSAVEERILHLARWYGARVVCDPAQAVLLMQRLRRFGVRVEEHEFTAARNTRLALRLLELIRAHRIELPADDGLVEELLNLRVKELGPGLFRLDTVAGRHDDRAITLGMACMHLDIDRPPSRPGGFVPTGRILR
jgi:hypothetical protein